MYSVQNKIKNILNRYNLIVNLPKNYAYNLVSNIRDMDTINNYLETDFENNILEGVVNNKKIITIIDKFSNIT